MEQISRASPIGLKRKVALEATKSANSDQGLYPNPLLPANTDNSLAKRLDMDDMLAPHE